MNLLNFFNKQDSNDNIYGLESEFCKKIVILILQNFLNNYETLKDIKNTNSIIISDSSYNNTILSRLFNIFNLELDKYNIFSFPFSDIMSLTSSESPETFKYELNKYIEFCLDNDVNTTYILQDIYNLLGISNLVDEDKKYT
jgi:hypothetical protein